MKFIIKSILNTISEQRPSDNKQLRIRLSGFEDVRIYEEVCIAIHEEYSYLNVETRLSTEKYKYYLDKGNLSAEEAAALKVMLDNGWTAKDKSLTYYRNLTLDEAQLIVLMGTEAVDDQGGLSDIFYIDPSKIVTELRGDYSCIFGVDIKENTSDAAVINRLYKDLFAIVPLNICKLSDIADQWLPWDNISDYVSDFYRKLPQWGLCRDVAGAPSVTRIKQTGRNLLQANSDFVTRKAFRKMSKKQFMDFIEKTELYPFPEKLQDKYKTLPRFLPDWEGWNDQGLTYDELSNKLVAFIAGQHLAENREALQTVDFAIIDDILNLKKQPKVKSQKIVVQGAPLNAITHAVCALAGISCDEEFDGIMVKFKSIELAGAIDPQSNEDEEQQIIRAWARVCLYSGGLFDYIRNRGIEIAGESIEFIANPDNLFAPNCVELNVREGLVSAASSNKKLCKAVFDVTRCFNGKTVEKATTCEWTFALSEGWNSAFDGICNCYYDWREKGIESYLPLLKIENYEELAASKSEEEFVDILSESAIICNFNITDKVAKHAADSLSKKWIAKLYSLGASFVNFCRSINENGFYGDIVKGGDSKVTAFIDEYNKLGKEILSTKFPSTMGWVFNSFIHAFAIEADDRTIRNNEAQDSCIIPPFHPVILEKFVDQATFLYDGCREILLDNDEHTALGKICDAIDGLEQMSEIHEGVDIFPGKNQTFFGTNKTFSNYCVCGNVKPSVDRLLAGIRSKDDVFDDDFNVNTFKKMNDASRMYWDVIQSYLQAMPDSRFNLAIAIVNPGDLQPIVAAVYSHIQEQVKYLDEHHEEYAEGQRIAVQLHILVSPENKGGRSYLTYWVNSFFSQDENVDVKVYLNEWEDAESLYAQLKNNTDILFLQDVLKLDQLAFIQDNMPKSVEISDCRFPIVFKPIPVEKESVKRRIELTQKQFTASTIHSQVVSYGDKFDSFDYQKTTVTKVLSIDRDRQDLILKLHDYSNWVVCVDGGMDGALLRDRSAGDAYSIIGFSTGKGFQGQNNLTITSRASIINAVKGRLKSKLKTTFGWDNRKIDKAANNCMSEASRLDGVSLLSAINPKGFKINEFLAYVLTAAKIERQGTEKGFRVIIHLDSYNHWFIHDKKSADDNNMRPDFLMITANIDDNDKVVLDAKIIECKLAQYSNIDVHKTKARKQVVHGIERLSALFDPESKSISRRYWYAQLYRALAFAQITFSSDMEDFLKISESLRSILEGNFAISWSGCVMGYWKDLNGETEIVTVDSENSLIEYHDIPQQLIQKLLLADDSESVIYAEVNDPDDEEYTVDINEDEDAEYYDDTSEENESDIVVTSNNDTDTNISNSNIAAADNGDKNGNETVAVSEEEQENNETSESTNNSTTGDWQQDIDAKGEANDDAVNGSEDNTALAPEKKNLEDVRVYIGKDRNSKVYWEFGNPRMANKHLLITGTSGQGKTYCIQTMLKELSENGVPAVIFDYTEGFRLDQLDPAFTAALGNKLDQKIVYCSGVPIDPFARHEIEIAGMVMKEKPADVAQRIANIFMHVYKFGEQQCAAIYSACRAGIEQYGEAMSIAHLREKLEEDKSSFAKTALSKMTPFLDSAEFVKDPDFSWEKVIHSDGTITVIQLTNFVREIQVIITEMMLWDAWHYNKKFGNKDTPFVVVLDEAQNLSHKEASPSAMILTEGRKFGWSAWFATQSLKVLSADEIVRLQQSAFKLYFKPTDEEITSIAKSIDPSTGGAANWNNTLKSLRKGQAIVAGDRLRPDGNFGHVTPSVTGIASFAERANETK